MNKDITSCLSEIKKQEEILLNKIRSVLDSIIAELKKSKNIGKVLSKSPRVISVSLKDIREEHNMNLSPEYFDSQFQVECVAKKLKDVTSICAARDIISKIVEDGVIIINKNKIPVNNSVMANLEKVLKLLNS